MSIDYLISIQPINRLLVFCSANNVKKRERATPTLAVWMTTFIQDWNVNHPNHMMELTSLRKSYTQYAATLSKQLASGQPLNAGPFDAVGEVSSSSSEDEAGLFKRKVKDQVGPPPKKAKVCLVL